MVNKTCTFGDVKSFLQAQMLAERDKKKRFSCPLCGGEAEWARSSYNKHLFAVCRKCGLRLME